VSAEKRFLQQGTQLAFVSLIYQFDSIDPVGGRPYFALSPMLVNNGQFGAG